MNGEMPKTADDLLKHLPGVGKYTAGAIASISYKQVFSFRTVNYLFLLQILNRNSMKEHRNK